MIKNLQSELKIGDRLLQGLWRPVKDDYPSMKLLQVGYMNSSRGVYTLFAGYSLATGIVMPAGFEVIGGSFFL